MSEYEISPARIFLYKDRIYDSVLSSCQCLVLTAHSEFAFYPEKHVEAMPHCVKHAKKTADI